MIEKIPAVAFNEDGNCIVLTTPEYVMDEKRQVIVDASLYESFCAAVEGLKSREVSGVFIKFGSNGLLFKQGGEKELFWSIDVMANFILGVKKGVYALDNLKKHTKKIVEMVEEEFRDVPGDTTVLSITKN